MRKHQIENLIWREMVWQRPFRLETVWEVLTHLSAMTPRGAVIWECRGSNGNIAHLLGADRMHIGKFEQVFRAHGDVQFHDIPYNVRTPVKVSRQLKITHPVLSLNTDVTAAVIRAGLAALTENKRGVETVLQVVLGRGFAPSPTPADLPDPNASWLNVLFGSVSKASTEDRKTARQKADQHGFQVAIRIGVSDERATARLRSLLSALKILESAGVRIYDEVEDAHHLNNAHASTPTAALRAASRNLRKLRELGLIDHLSRRIGGVRAGSGAMVWYLTHAGERLIYLRSYTLTPTKRFFEPSPYFLAHTLAVADVAVQLTELCRDNCRMELSAIQPEPGCWRTYSEYGSVLVLKPDLFAITSSDKYEDRWFIEVDLDTESPVKVVEKCEKYHRYYRSGLEQQESEVFPLTVWIAPTAARKERLLSHIREAFDKQPKLFTVITKDELTHLIQYGGDERMLC